MRGSDFYPHEWHEDEGLMRRDAKKAFVKNLRSMLEQYDEHDEAWQAAIRLMRWRHLELSIINKRINDAPIVTLPSVELYISVHHKFRPLAEPRDVNTSLHQRDVALAINELATTHRQVMAGVFYREARKYWNSVHGDGHEYLTQEDTHAVFLRPSHAECDMVHDMIWRGEVPLKPDQRAA